MQDFEGTLIRAGEIVLDPVVGSIEVDMTPTGLKRWSGFLRVMPGSQAAIREQYLLQFRDGRSGLIVTQSVSAPGGGRTFVRFIGTTALQ
jgi:hypothetical protein